jgi:hypothetical protein
MNYYYMNSKEYPNPIVCVSGIESVYKDLVDEYLLNGGEIKVIEAGRRTLSDEAKAFRHGMADMERTIDSPPGAGTSLFDEIQAQRTMPNIEDYFDNPEGF